VQVFRYVTDAEAAAEKARHEEELQKAADQRQKAAGQGPAPQKVPDAAAPKAEPDAKDSATPKTP
jgi:hypothetical protein